MAQIQYTPPAWLTSATCLLYKPNKTDPTNPACYRPIALMNCILKLWTSVLTTIGTDWAESHGILNDHSDGFRADRQTYDSLATHLYCLEDAKLNKKDIYTMFADFRSAFNGTDHTILFAIMEDLGMPPSYIEACRQLYAQSKTYYMTPHGDTAPINIDRGTLQGDTLSPFLFTLFIEPLMRWLRVGSRGYRPTGHKPDTFVLSYDEHGYADDISITTETLPNLKTQLHKLHLFSEYTGLELEIPKCVVTGALWSRGNPKSRPNLRLLEDQISTIRLSGNSQGPKLAYLPPTSSYKMLGVHINPLLDFNDHFRAIMASVQALIPPLKRANLSPGRKHTIIQQLLQSKFHATHLGVFSPAQMIKIDTKLNTAFRHAYRLMPSFPVDALHEAPSSMGLGKQHIATRARQQAIVHTTKMMNKPTDRGRMAYTHTASLIHRFRQWPREALPHRLPTLNAISMICEDPLFCFQGLPTPEFDNEIARTIRQASQAVDLAKLRERETLSDITDPAEYKARSRETRPPQAAPRLLKHFTPLWRKNIFSWSTILYTTADGKIRARSPKDITVKAHKSSQLKPDNTTDRPLRTLISILSRPSSTPYSTLPNPTAQTGHTDIHPSWAPLLPADLPRKDRPDFSDLIANAIRGPATLSSKLKATHQHEHFHVLCNTVESEFDITQIHDRRALHGQTQYLVSWAPESLTKAQILQYTTEGFTLVTSEPTVPDDETGEQLYSAQWAPAWQKLEAIRNAPSYERCLQDFKHRPQPLRRVQPPTAHQEERGWYPVLASFDTTPCNPDLDSKPTGRYEITTHPDPHSPLLLHDPTGYKVGDIPQDKMDILHALYSGTARFPEALMSLLTRTKPSKRTNHKEIPLRTADGSTQPPAPLYNPQWNFPAGVLRGLQQAFQIDRIYTPNPLDMPVSDIPYYTDQPEDSLFSARPAGNLIWPGTTLVLPGHTPKAMSAALERAICQAHKYRTIAGAASLLILPINSHTAYIDRNITSPYVQRITQTPAPWSAAKNTRYHLYLIANPDYFLSSTIRRTYTQAQRTIREAFKAAGHEYDPILLYPYVSYASATAVDSTTKYKRITKAEHEAERGKTPGPRWVPAPFARKLNPEDYIYTDGSLITGNPTVGAAITYPKENLTIRMKIESDPVRHTINRAELAAIAHALVRDQNNTNISVLTDSAYCINTTRNFCHAPYKYKNNPHYDLLRLMSNALREREEAGLRTHIGKVKSHTGITYNDAADQGANSVAAGGQYDITFDLANPPPGGHRVWPCTVPRPDEDPVPFRDLKRDSRTSAARHRAAPPTTKHGARLREAQSTGTDLTIHAYSKSNFSQRANALEVGWGTYYNKFRYKLPKGQPLICRHCQQQISNAHITGDCPGLQNLRTDRHNSTFKILSQYLDNTEDPILTTDLGAKVIRDFSITPKYTPMSKTDVPAKPDKPNIIPEEFLPKDKRPRGCKPDMIRLKGCLKRPGRKLHPNTPSRGNHKGQRVMQLIECKYSTDTRLQDTISEIHTKYAPLRQAIIDHGNWGGEVEIIPIVISRTGSFHTKTLAEIAQLISPQEEPPDALTYRRLPKPSQKLVMTMHVHAQNWLTKILQHAKQVCAPRRGGRGGTKAPPAHLSSQPQQHTN